MKLAECITCAEIANDEYTARLEYYGLEYTVTPIYKQGVGQ